MQQFYVPENFFFSSSEIATVYNLCIGGTEGKYHLYFFPSAFKNN